MAEQNTVDTDSIDFTMDSGPYFSYVDQVAEALYDELCIGQWIVENYLRHCGNEEIDLDQFWYDDEEEHGDERSYTMHSFLDAAYKWQSFKEAAYVIACTKYNPDDVDSGTYEGAQVEQMLRTIAFECFREDIQDRLRELFDEDLSRVENGTRGEELRTQSSFHYPDTEIQKGYWPRLRKFQFAADGDSSTASAPSPQPGIEKFIVFAEHGRLALDKFNTLVLEGKTHSADGYLVVLAKRVYVMFDNRMYDKKNYNGEPLRATKKDARAMDIDEAMEHAFGDGLVDCGWFEE